MIGMREHQIEWRRVMIRIRDALIKFRIALSGMGQRDRNGCSNDWIGEQ